MTYADTSRTADLIDSRDVIERYRELSTQGEQLTEDEYREVHALIELIDQGESLSDWEYGVVLVSDAYFEEYAQQFAEDVYGFDSATSQWPMCHIDWEAAADSLRMDYTEIDYDGVTFWAR